MGDSCLQLFRKEKMKKEEKILTIAFGEDKDGVSLFNVRWFKDKIKDCPSEGEFMSFLANLGKDDKFPKALFKIIKSFSEAFVSHEEYIVSGGEKSGNSRDRFIRIIRTFHLGWVDSWGRIHTPFTNAKRQKGIKND